MSDLPEGVTRVLDPGGRDALRLDGAAGSAVVSLTGAQVLSWHVAGRDVLWTASAPEHAPGKPVRGGIPIVFPWFGDHRSDPSQPAHGFARSLAFACVAAEPGPRVTLRAADDAATRARWPHAFSLEVTVALGPGLEVAMSVANLGREPMRFEQALHTYFSVGDVHSASVHGLEGVAFVEHAREPEPGWDPDAPLRFRAETDRVFQDVPASLELRAPALGRTVRLDTENARSTIVWTPWPNKAGRLSQMAGDDWQRFCCIESANVHDHPVVLPPGAAHTLRLRLTCTDGAG